MKRLPDSLRALGRGEPPTTVDVDGGRYALARVFKHDFFAATALYEGERGKIVLKIGRRADFLGLPTLWIGRLLAGNEAAVLRDLHDLDAVPTCLGRWGDTGVVHEYVEGAHLTRDSGVPDDFFSELRRVVDTIHRRNIAVVDLEKPQNVLLGDDGRPHLVDFQIALRVSERTARTWPPVRWLLRRFQEGDRYHLLKLQRRFRRDQLTDDQVRQSYRKPIWVRWHGWITRPLLKLRRHTLNRLDPARQVSERGTVGG
ncbi:MAG: hypothetical protein HOP29_15875 [Phycisphaerales bacterium]|nr:hypothetical protein [Phycisphaerales bacterium]